MIASPCQWCVQAHHAQDRTIGVLVFGLMAAPGDITGDAIGGSKSRISTMV